MTRNLIVVTALLGGLTMAAAAPAGAVAGFGDVEDHRYYTDAVQWMVDEGITTGTSDTCFSPDGLATRGEVAAFLHRLAGEPVPSAPHPFTDVIADWQEAPVSWMFAAGVTTGTSATTYSPNVLVTRGEFAAMLHRLAGEPSAPPHPFVDIVRAWQEIPVAWMFATGVTTGTSPNTFSPELPMTRAQIATFLYRWSGAPPIAVDGASPHCESGAGTRSSNDTGYGTFATVGPVELRFPAAESELVGYHESGHDGARQMEPTASDVSVTVMETRHRGTGSRTAADVVVAPDTEIRAPVTGTVVRGGGYVLYCDHRDEFLVIEPDTRPGWEVKILHFQGLTVAAGDRVEAGVTVIGANATFLPFVSQVDGLTASPSWPHVHVEVVDPSIPDRPSGRSC